MVFRLTPTVTVPPGAPDPTVRVSVACAAARSAIDATQRMRNRPVANRLHKSSDCLVISPAIHFGLLSLLPSYQPVIYAKLKKAAKSWEPRTNCHLGIERHANALQAVHPKWQPSEGQANLRHTSLPRHPVSCAKRETQILREELSSVEIWSKLTQEKPWACSRDLVHTLLYLVIFLEH